MDHTCRVPDHQLPSCGRILQGRRKSLGFLISIGLIRPNLVLPVQPSSRASPHTLDLQRTLNLCATAIKCGSGIARECSLTDSTKGMADSNGLALGFLLQLFLRLNRTLGLQLTNDHRRHNQHRTQQGNRRQPLASDAPDDSGPHRLTGIDQRRAGR